MKKINIFSLITGIIGVGCIASFVIPVIVALVNQSQSNSIGIIGGGDNPTMNFILSRLVGTLPGLAFLLGVPLVLSSIFALIFKKTVSNCCSLKTTILSVLISAMVSAGFFCFINCFLIAALGEVHEYPRQYPWSVAGNIIAFVATLLLLALYIFMRTKKPSGKGVIIDILTVAIYVPFMFLVFANFVEWLTWVANVVLS